ncbi:hypothetical protein C5E10_06270 [Pseudoclavibacter sp. RFBG4]|uniref:hypothetical protein n=1 Tax=Pseudoclavibacter sp. RFBG4 TaxID=2080575 RepID=UPI000CE8070A|nr:hypothetical protein [Pseudoclavibacter sp. RFBG4]PPG35193.1 hypothetical protein C5E10_06270 [Pseudoclavibacter sp. RFBG4]
MSKIKSSTALGVVGGLAVAAMIAGGIAFTVVSIQHEETHTCTVTGKDLRMPSTSDEAQSPRLYTAECGTFQIADVLFVSYESGDIYGSLVEGEAYELTTRGFRIPIMSVFPSIVEVEAVGRG